MTMADNLASGGDDPRAAGAAVERMAALMGPSGAINAVGLSRARFTANEAPRRIGRNADAAQLVRKFLAPLALRGLADIQALALCADRVPAGIENTSFCFLAVFGSISVTLAHLALLTAD